jgi:hypothetical protein
MLSPLFRIVMIRPVGFGRTMIAPILALLTGSVIVFSAPAALAGDKPDVEVNLGVLDKMSPPQTPSDPSTRVTLHPPKHKKKVKAAQSNTVAANVQSAAPSSVTSTTAPAVAAGETVAAAPREKVSATPLPSDPPPATATSPATTDAPSAGTAAATTSPAAAVTAMNVEPARAVPPATPPSPPVTRAAAPATAGSAPIGDRRVLFAGNAIDLPDSAKPDLDALV